MTAYICGRLLDTADGPEIEHYQPPSACGQYPAHDSPDGAARVLEAGGADRGTWRVYRVEDTSNDD